MLTFNVNLKSEALVVNTFFGKKIMIVIAQVLSRVVLIVGCLSLRGDAAEAQCPDSGLAVIVAHQNEFMLNLAKEQQKIIAQLSFMEDELRLQVGGLTTDLNITQVDLLSVQSELMTAKTELQLTSAEVETIKNQVKDIEAELLNVEYAIQRKRRGSTYVRWGRKGCPDRDNTLVYSGIVGGKYYTHKGSGTNPLCLTMSPSYDETPKPRTVGYLYGSEYEDFPTLQDKEIPCSVCHTPYSTTIMIPSTNRCPKGWTTQYEGHLVSGYYLHYALEFVCLDRNPEGMSATAHNANGLLFYIVVSKCGSLPCPPFGDDRGGYMCGLFQVVRVQGCVWVVWLTFCPSAIKKSLFDS